MAASRMKVRSAGATCDASTAEPAARPAWIHTTPAAAWADAAEVRVTGAEVATAHAPARITATSAWVTATAVATAAAEV